MEQDEILEKFGSKYFKTDNYKSYLRRKFDRQVTDLITLGIDVDDVIIDFGCATGGLLKSFFEKGYKFVNGTDISDWAIDNGRKLNPEIKLDYYNRNLLSWKNKHWVILLDVLEHMESEELRRVMYLLKKYPALKGCIVRVPVSLREGDNFVLDESCRDKTHIQCHTKRWWKEMFETFGYKFKPLNLRTIYDSDGVLAGVFKYEEIKKKK